MSESLGLVNFRSERSPGKDSPAERKARSVAESLQIAISSLTRDHKLVEKEKRKSLRIVETTLGLQVRYVWRSIARSLSHPLVAC